jgi:magnesium-transporting ATPase (P-type)
MAKHIRTFIIGFLYSSIMTVISILFLAMIAGPLFLFDRFHNPQFLWGYLPVLVVVVYMIGWAYESRHV